VPTYLYTAKTKEGETKTGSREAIDQHELARYLREQGLILVSAEMTDQPKRMGYFDLRRIFQIFFRVSLVEKMVFSQQLSVMIRAGLSLNQALKVLAAQTKSYRFRKIINQVEESLRRGESLSEALAKYPKVFNELYVNMIRVGETGGNLDKVLEILAEQMRKDLELLRRVRGAMMYPAVVVTAMVGIGIMMMIVVVPKITEVFVELKIELPLTTRVVIGLSNFLQNHFLLGLMILFASIFLIRFILKINIVKRFLHQIYLHLPIFGPLVKKINSARLARTFSSLIKSGVAMIKALQITAGILGNVHFKKSLIKSAEQVQKGKDLSESLAEYTNLYPPMVIQIVQVGEETGSLVDTLTNLASFYEHEIDNTTKNLSSIIEPVVMIILGAAVGFFAVSMIQPMYSMMGAL